MSDGGLDAGVVTKGLGGALSTALFALIGYVIGDGTGLLGTALGHVLTIAFAACGLWFSVVYGRYRGILAASAPDADADERAGYLALRDNLAAGGAVARLYADRLGRFLAAVERFFGDAGMADRSLFPRFFWLKTPAPLWTAPAFDRCLLLALIYPVITIFLIWVVSGHVGPAEKALGLAGDFSAWARSVGLFGFATVVAAYWRFHRTEGRKALLWLTIAVSVPVTAIVAGVFAVPVVIAAGIAGVLAGAVVGAVGIATIASVIAFPFAFFAARVFRIIESIARRDRWQGKLQAYFTIVVTIFVFVASYGLATSRIWGTAAPLWLFLGLLTLINAPFDWASLGLTRALLRRGLELGGWWPLLLAAVDAAAAALIVAFLTMAMVLGVQAFDGLAVLGGGIAVLPLEPIFAGIGDSATAGEPEYWWVYALLLTTMIPSLINLGIGGASLMRGIPGLPALLLRSMPLDRAVRSYDRTWIALVLAGQTVGGVLLGILAQALIFWAVLAWVMPWLGLGLLDRARGLVALDLPGALWHWIGLAP